MTHEERKIFREFSSMTEKAPENDYGVRILFIKEFVREDMEAAYMGAAYLFLHNEPLVRERDLFKDLPLPFDNNPSVYSSFIQTTLGMMLCCATHGSSYASSIILELYKTYYRKEYNILKRFVKLGIDDYVETFREELDDTSEEEEDLSNETCARLTVMAWLLGLPLDSSWNAVYRITNENVEEDRELWRVIEATGMGEEILEKRAAERKECADWLTEEYPEAASKEVFEGDARYSIILDIENVIEHAADDMNVRIDRLLCNNEDLFSNITNILTIVPGAERERKKWGLKRKGSSFKERYTLREMLLLAYIDNITRAYGQLYRVREEELWSILQVSRYEVIPDDVLEDEWITKAMLQKLAEKRAKSRDADQRDEKFLKKIRALNVSEEDRLDPLEPAALETVSDDKTVDLGTCESETFTLEEELERLKKRIREAENRTTAQRLLLEESREKIAALEKIIEQQAREHSELTALRELVYQLDKTESEEQQISVDEMIQELRKIKGAVIGGQSTWANRIKKVLPDWKYIPAGESLGLDRALGGIETAFLATDALSHKMYYKMMGTIRNGGIPFHFLHVVNLDKVIEIMYECTEELRAKE